MGFYLIVLSGTIEKHRFFGIFRGRYPDLGVRTLVPPNPDLFTPPQFGGVTAKPGETKYRFSIQMCYML